MIRQPAVSGQFYPAEPDQLRAQVDDLMHIVEPPQKARAIIVPHAGYIYSGRVAGEVFAATEIPPQVILIGPNHYGYGPAAAVSGAEAWETPLGNVPVAVDLRQQLLTAISSLKMDDSAHELEHSLEVMLPFLQRRQADLSIVPIALRHSGLENCLTLGAELAQVLKQNQQKVLLLASSDMNHFSPAGTTEKLDSLAIEAMISYDLAQLYQVVRDYDISMCGVLPVIVAMQAARELGACTCHLVSYAHSGQVNGDNSSVVGYAGLLID